LLRGVRGEKPVALQGALHRALDRGQVVELDVQLLAARFKLVNPLELGAVPEEVLDLRLHLLDDHRRAPGGVFLRAEHVAVDVVSHVENAVAAGFRHPLEVHQVPALVYPDPFEATLGLAGWLPPGVEHQEGAALVEERRLGGAHDDNVEEVAPARILGEAPGEEEAHHRIGVVPERVGEEEQALAGGTELVQHERQLRVLGEEPARVAADDRLERIVAMDLVDAVPDVGEDRLEGRPAVRFAIGALDDLREERDLGEGEEGVDEVVAGKADPDLHSAVEAAALVLGEGALPVVGAADVTVAVHLQDVAELLVHDQPAHADLSIVAQTQEISGVAAGLDESLQGELERQLLDVGPGVVRERVVHVEPDHLDQVHSQVAVDPDPTRGRNGLRSRDLEKVSERVEGVRGASSGEAHRRRSRLWHGAGSSQDPLADEAALCIERRSRGAPSETEVVLGLSHPVAPAFSGHVVHSLRASGGRQIATDRPCSPPMRAVLHAT